MRPTGPRRLSPDHPLSLIHISWDITKLRGPNRGVYYDLYVVLDIFSRFVVAWTIAASEDSQIAKTMLEQAMGVHGIPQAVHADRGTSMTSKPVAQLMVCLLYTSRCV